MNNYFIFFYICLYIKEMSLETINEMDNETDYGTKHPMWEELRELRDALNKLGNIDVIKAYISEYMSDDVADLQKKYKEDFKDIDVSDPIRLEILQTLGEMGIMIYQ
jgi:hypothetical protein